MLTKRIVPCLDIKNGRTVKGVNFVDLRDAGDPVVLAKQYADLGADELVFLDISATQEKRKTMHDMVLKVAEQVNIPFTVGGGISSVEDVDDLLQKFWHYLHAGSNKQAAMQVLEIDGVFNAEDLTRQYRKMVMKHHPDRGGDKVKLQQINEAMETLKHCL